ncbi:N-acetylmuramoyl-L-alanine amidase [Tianweitania sp.]|uniref:N-acetylmuramoyl-L-alanine amidase n=1 Tax=Tianweitania sp. TaxID=2021634 RepID=UPI00289B3004|nr:N-acetylmuramoyl-L-alanine amidase [Tianweitania sp.]
MSAFPADFARAVVRPSPNFGPRRDCERPSLIILHYTGMITGQAAEDWLCVPESEVSSHYLVHEDGSVVQMVREADRAWHAGRSIWGGNADINSHSVGIEIVNPGHFLGYTPFPDDQIAAVVDLCRDIATRHAMLPEGILAHSDVAPGRKIDPGELFPWASLHAAGIGHFVQPEPIGDDLPFGLCATSPDVAKTQQMLADYGYGIQVSGVLDEAARIVVEAFQRHFRPERVDGLIDRSTRLTLSRLLRNLPVSPSV